MIKSIILNVFSALILIGIAFGENYRFEKENSKVFFL